VIPITVIIKKHIKDYGMPRKLYGKSADVVINREMKEVCSLAGVDEVIQSRKSQSVVINDKQTRRTISMEYPKYQVISTHSLRRSFATNYKDTLTPYQTRQITGHSSDAQLLEYINQDKDRSEIVKQMASKMNLNEVQRKEKTTRLKVIKNASNQ
jgi:pyruvate dehydrogenase complex dehydrogenase (E1) component